MKKKAIPAKACRSVLSKFGKFLSPEAFNRWENLGAFHDSTDLAAKVPNMPYTQLPPGEHSRHNPNRESPGIPITYRGGPMLLKPILSSMRRFPRPNIMYDPFLDQPPLEWNKIGAATAAAPAAGADQQVPLRDPRIENTVTHLGYLPRQRNEAMRQLAVENHRDDAVDAGGVIVEAKSLYLVRVGELDGDVRLGLGYVHKVGASEVKQKVWWFVRKSKTATWGRTVQFKPYTSGNGRRLFDQINIDAFVLKVNVIDLTNASRSKWRDEPCLSTSCVQSAKAIAETLQQRDDAAAAGIEEENSGQEEVDPLLLSIKEGDTVYAEDDHKDWVSARVREVKMDNGVLSCLVHYDGWATRYDAWLEVNSGRISRSMPIFSDYEEDSDEDDALSNAKASKTKAKAKASKAKDSSDSPSEDSSDA